MGFHHRRGVDKRSKHKMTLDLVVEMKIWLSEHEIAKLTRPVFLVSREEHRCLEQQSVYDPVTF